MPFERYSLEPKGMSCGQVPERDAAESPSTGSHEPTSPLENYRINKLIVGGNGKLLASTQESDLQASLRAALHDPRSSGPI